MLIVIDKVESLELCHLVLYLNHNQVFLDDKLLVLAWLAPPAEPIELSQLAFFG